MGSYPYYFGHLSKIVKQNNRCTFLIVISKASYSSNVIFNSKSLTALTALLHLRKIAAPLERTGNFTSYTGGTSGETGSNHVKHNDMLKFVWGSKVSALFLLFK